MSSHPFQSLLTTCIFKTNQLVNQHSLEKAKAKQTSPLVMTLIHFYPFPTITHYVPKIHHSTELPSPSRSSKCPFSKKFPTKILYASFVSLIVATFPAYHSSLHFTILKTLNCLHKPQSSSLSNKLNCSLHTS